MKIIKHEFVLYGLNKHKEIIDEIIRELNAADYTFDIKLILTEALTNAFKHGNNSNIKKPIYLRYYYDGENVKFEIEDLGMGVENIIIPNEVLEENLMNDKGRGLFLIKCLVDKMELRNNTIILQKHLSI